MHIETFPVGQLGCNCSILADEDTGAAIVVDPGGDFDEIKKRLEKLNAKVRAIVHTHTHIDHVGATAPLAAWTEAPARIHEADRFLYDMLPIQAAMIGIAEPERCEVKGDLKDETLVTVDAMELLVLHTPGHTPGSVSFLARTADRAVAFAGDTLFRRGVGRTDLWGGDSGNLVTSIQQKLFSLDDETLVITGHGPETTIGEERSQNPFVGARS